MGWPTRHGLGSSPEYMAWQQMKHRCHNEKSPNYKYYGGRGIRVCKEWRTSFVAFIEHIGLRPTPQHSLDRVDVNRDYEPGNVRWTTIIEQNRNKRTTFEPHEPEQIRWLYSLGYSQAEIARHYSSNQTAVGRIVRGESYT